MGSHLSTRQARVLFGREAVDRLDIDGLTTNHFLITI